MTELYNGVILGGCLPDKAAHGDFPVLKKTSPVNRPRSVDLTPWCSMVEDQKRVGSCVGNAIAGALEYHLIRNGRPRDLSRLFIYYNARRLVGEEGRDVGCSRRVALASVMAYGVCPEAMWPYQEAMVFEQPIGDCYKAAERIRGVEFAELTHGDPVCDALASGLPVVFGMAVPPQLLKEFGGKHGYMKPPEDGNWEAARSGHAMLIVGYDDDRNAFLVRNSWGTGWGAEGHVWIDYDVLFHYTQPPVYHGNKPFVIGAIAENPAYQISGPASQHIVQSVTASAAAPVQAELAGFRHSVASHLDDHLDKTRQSIRDRLRGPGAGGGY